MSHYDVRLDILEATIEKLDDPFHTKDVSEHPDMKSAHPALLERRNYHAFVGQRISTSVVGAKQIGTGKRGALWTLGGNGASEAAHAVEERPVVEMVPGDALVSSEPDTGPQYAKDDPFTRRMRLHQSWYRAQVLGVPCGVGPTAGSPNRYGNMLTPEDGERGLNFLTPEIYEVVKRNLGAGEPYRLKHNMLSSQPMCFNLFGPLVDDLDLATRLMRPIIGDQLEAVTRVLIEYAPAPRSEYLDDATAFDAFVEYRRRDGDLGFVGIETKLTEPFSRSHYDRPSYRRWMEGPESPWLPEAGTKVDAIAHNQLWRDHLLAVALLNHTRSPYRHGALMLVRHGGDAKCARVVRGYRKLLRPGDETFLDMPLAELVDRWSRCLDGGHHQEWLAAFQRRYVDVD